MKKLVLLVMALVSIQAFAQHRQDQERKERAHKMHNLSPEDAANLQAKKMTLHLDLSEKQQAEVKEVLLANAKARKAKMDDIKTKKESGEFKRPTQEERVKMANERLDRQIAMKAKMKSILNEEQYTKWEKAYVKMSRKRQDMRKKHQKKY